ncbi:hypothetical protein HK102_008061, partial [Quaeritorhiza haematococci]
SLVRSAPTIHHSTHLPISPFTRLLLPERHGHIPNPFANLTLAVVRNTTRRVSSDPASSPALAEVRTSQIPAVRVKWTEGEDERLRAAIRLYGVGKWTKISAFVGTRSAGACCKRWRGCVPPTIKKGAWSEADDEKLKEAIDTYGERQWTVIAAMIPGRTGSQCHDRWKFCLCPQKRKGKWTAVEDALLKAGIEKYGYGNWESIASTIHGRTARQCRVRWRWSASPDIKKGKWTFEEDGKLEAYIELTGAGDWESIAATIPGKTGHQCRVRWISCLSPEIKKGPWTAKEDEFLRRGIERFGEGKWEAISAMIPGRSAPRCSRRWSDSLRPGVRQGRWTKQEDALLRAGIQNFGEGNWAAIAAAIPERTGTQCFKRWAMCMSPNIKKGTWSRAEDELLTAGIRNHGLKAWQKIADTIS